MVIGTVLNRHNRITACGTAVWSGGKVADYVSDRLEFHHPGSGLSNVQTETK